MVSICTIWPCKGIQPFRESFISIAIIILLMKYCHIFIAIIQQNIGQHNLVRQFCSTDPYERIFYVE